MFIPIYQLNIDNKEAKEAEDRWKQNNDTYRYILELIKRGAGEDFLQKDFESGRLPFLRDMCDLRGFYIYRERITFPTDDNFEAIDFSYAQFQSSEIENCCFLSTFRFSKFHHCIFKNCTFHFSLFLGCIIRHCRFVNCKFTENTSMENCDFGDVVFDKCLYDEVIFNNCRFNANCKINDPKKPKRNEKNEFNRELSSFNTSVSEAYKEGGIFDKSRLYYYKSRKARTRYNSNNIICRLGGKIIELITGYGVKPARPLICLVLIVLIFTGIFYIRLGSVYSALTTSVNAILTMGDSSSLSCPFDVLYMIEGFLGVAIIGLYITLLANMWFSQR